MLWLDEKVVKLLGFLATGIGLIYLLNSVSDLTTPIRAYIASIIVIVAGLILLFKKLK